MSVPAASPAAARGAAPRTVAIDGPAGSGKSTAARVLAERLGLDRLDTGAMYRAVAWAALDRGVDPGDAAAVAALAGSLAIEVGDRVVVGGVDATEAIRTPDVDRAVSAVAANPSVRRELVRRQRDWVAERGAGVLEGRDIGTVVLPGADVKVYLTASVEERARRRSSQLGAAGDGDAVASVAAALERRDRLDSGRADSPLVRPEDVADDALLLDTTDLDPDAVADAVLVWWEQRGRARRTAVTGAPSAEASGGRAATGPAGGPVTGRGGAMGATGARAGAATPAGDGFQPEVGGRAANLGVPDGVYRFLRWLAHRVNRGYLRVDVTGAEHVPASGPVILAPVHRSFIDFLVASEATPRKVFYMAKDELWRSPRLGALIESLGGFPVNRTGADRLSLDRARSVLDRGDVLILFPEGTRRTGPVVEDLHEGAAFLAARTGAPMVPIGIWGTEDAMPKGKRLPRRTRVRMVVGEALEPPPRSERGRVPRHQVRELNDELQRRLQRCYDTARGT